jgi:hypothetical protein
MDYALNARVQALLEGVPLPAEKQELLSYARGQRPEPDELSALQRLPDRQYSRLDEVGEELARVQPSWEKPEPHEPQEASDAVPGGIRDYVTANPSDTGRVRDVEHAES